MASLEPAVHAELLAVQSALSALVATVKKLTSGALPQPPSTTRSASRRRRRQATLLKLFDASQRRSAELVDKEVQAPCLEVAQPDVEVPIGVVSEAEGLEVPFPTPDSIAHHIVHPHSQVDLFQSGSSVCAFALPLGVGGFSDTQLAYGDACRLSNVVNCVKDLLDRSLFGFEKTLGRGPRSRGAEGKPVSKEQFVALFNGSFTPGVGPSDASVSKSSVALQPPQVSGHECKQQ